MVLVFCLPGCDRRGMDGEEGGNVMYPQFLVAKRVVKRGEMSVVSLIESFI